MKILNFGSLNIDYVYTVEHFVLPGETISATKLELFCGGKGLNQSIALARAGVSVYHAGKIGKDGEMLQNKLLENGVNISLIEYSEAPSGHAIIQVDKKGQNCIMLSGGANQDIDKIYVDSVLSHFEKGDILLLQNEISCMTYIAESAFEKGMRIAFNPSPVDNIIEGINLNYIEWLILNEIEGKELTNEENPQATVRSLLKNYPNMKVVLTLGKSGVMYHDKFVQCKHGIYDVKVVDTTAAGDTFTGYFIGCISEGLSVEIALKKASVASSISVSHKGASNSIPKRTEVDNSNLKLLEKE